MNETQIWSIIQPLLPGDKNRHVTVNRTQLHDILRYVDDLTPFFYGGVVWELHHKHLGVGVYRIWFEVAK